MVPTDVTMDPSAILAPQVEDVDAEASVQQQTLGSKLNKPIIQPLMLRILLMRALHKTFRKSWKVKLKLGKSTLLLLSGFWQAWTPGTLTWFLLKVFSSFLSFFIIIIHYYFLLLQRLLTRQLSGTQNVHKRAAEGPYLDEPPSSRQKQDEVITRGVHQRVPAISGTGKPSTRLVGYVF